VKEEVKHIIVFKRLELEINSYEKMGKFIEALDDLLEKYATRPETISYEWEDEGE